MLNTCKAARAARIFPLKHRHVAASDTMPAKMPHTLRCAHRRFTGIFVVCLAQRLPAECMRIRHIRTRRLHARHEVIRRSLLLLQLDGNTGESCFLSAAKAESPTKSGTPSELQLNPRAPRVLFINISIWFGVLRSGSPLNIVASVRTACGGQMQAGAAQWPPPPAAGTAARAHASCCVPSHASLCKEHPTSHVANRQETPAAFELLQTYGQQVEWLCILRDHHGDLSATGGESRAPGSTTNTHIELHKNAYRTPL